MKQILILLCVAGMSDSLSAQPSREMLGSELRLELLGGDRIQAELIAARRDTLWLMSRERQLFTIQISDVLEARVPHTGMTGKGMLIWTTVGALTTGGLLQMACSSVEDADCTGIFPGVVLAWGVFGGLSAAYTRSGSHRLVRARTEDLVPYARFPQGIPYSYLVTEQWRTAPDSLNQR